MKPVEYCDSCTVTEDTPYQVEGSDLKGTHSGTGTLHLGRVVWIRKSSEDHGLEPWISVYAKALAWFRSSHASFSLFVALHRSSLMLLACT